MSSYILLSKVSLEVIYFIEQGLMRSYILLSKVSQMLKVLSKVSQVVESLSKDSIDWIMDPYEVRKDSRSQRI